MGERTPGPICSTRVGDQWIDGGTMCRTKSDAAGPTGVDRITEIIALNLQRSKTKFDTDHVYSTAREAARKRDIDLQIIGDNYARSSEIRLDNETYLKELIRLASGGKQTVSGNARNLQFFIVRGGAEGLLSPDMASVDAGNVVFPGSTTNGKKSADWRFDNNDLLAVFDPKGKLIRAVLLQRPISIPGTWSARNATKVYDSWHNRAVAIYRNDNFAVPYLGLVVDDGMKKSVGWVDIHKQEATNGCIFVVDEDTPPIDTEALNTFEPKLMHEILASIGKTADKVKGSITLGTMRVVIIK